jgi:hypothetical protein
VLVVLVVVVAVCAQKGPASASLVTAGVVASEVIAIVLPLTVLE